MLDIELFRPMLAASFPSAKRNVPSDEEVREDLERLDWTRGFWCSPKLDGIRAVKHPIRGLVSRTLTPIPNEWVQKALGDPMFNFLDGELVKGRWNDVDINYNTNQSAIMSEGGVFEFTYACFDHLAEPLKSYKYRNTSCDALLAVIGGEREIDGQRFHVHYLEQTHTKDIDELLEYEKSVIAQGFEGVIARDWGCKYKNGRATWRQQGMFKMKRFVDGEAEIVGFEEKLENWNEATKDARGYQVRSSHKDGMVPAGTTGLLTVRGLNGQFTGVEFGIGSGLDDGLRTRIWEDRDGYIGKVVKYKYQQVGNKNKPRAPIFLGFRTDRD